MAETNETATKTATQSTRSIANWIGVHCLITDFIG